AGEERRPVRARHHADLDRDRAYGARVAPVDARLAVEDPLAHDAALEPEERALDGLLGPLGLIPSGERREGLGLDLGEPRVPLLLLGEGVSLGERRLRMEAERAHELGVFGRRLPAPAGLARFRGELLDDAAAGLTLLVAAYDAP